MVQGSKPRMSKHPPLHVLYSVIPVLGLGLAPNTLAQTLIHRCAKPSGEIEFRQRPCTDGSEGQQLNIDHRESGWTPAKAGTKEKARQNKDRRSRKAPGHAEAARARQEEQCWKKRELLDEVNWQLKRGYKPGKGVKLRHRRRAYEDYISRYCD
jgi:hypothetical protein